MTRKARARRKLREKQRRKKERGEVVLATEVQAPRVEIVYAKKSEEERSFELAPPGPPLSQPKISKKPTTVWNTPGRLSQRTRRGPIPKDNRRSSERW